MPVLWLLRDYGRVYIWLSSDGATGIITFRNHNAVVLLGAETLTHPSGLPLTFQFQKQVTVLFHHSHMIQRLVLININNHMHFPKVEVPLPKVSNWERCVFHSNQDSTLIKVQNAVLFFKNLDEEKNTQAHITSVLGVQGPQNQPT